MIADTCPRRCGDRGLGYIAQAEEYQRRENDGQCQRECATCSRWVWPDRAADCPDFVPVDPRQVYVASRTRHAAFWRNLRDARGWPIISTWIDEAEPGQTASHAELWERVIREVQASAGLALLVQRDDVLTGALVEVGAALGAGLPVVIVGSCPQVEKPCGFPSHPLVSRAVTAVAAMRRLLSPADASDGGASVHSLAGGAK